MAVRNKDLSLVDEAEASETGIAVDLTEELDVMREEGGYTTLYDQRTGEPSRIRLWEGDKTLRHYLNKLDANGNRIFGTRKPKVSAPKPTIPCWLSAASDKFQFFAGIGMTPSVPCTKMLFSDAQVRDHMENVHPDEFKADAAENAIDRDAMLIKALQALANKE